MMAKAGRSAMPADLKKDRRVTFLVTGAEMEMLESAATAAGAASLSAWVRDVLLREAGQGGRNAEQG